MAPSPFSRRRDDAAGGGGDALSRVPFMALLDGGLRDRVRKRLNRRRVAAGKPLFRVGDPSDALYLVESGRFRVFVGERAPKERVLHFVGAGEVLGESAFMAETANVTSAVAVEDSTVWRLAREDFNTLLGNHEPVLRYLAQLVSERQAQANARLAAESAPDETRAMRGYVSAIYSPRGGAGSTTIALNVAIGLAERHPDDAVLLDLDVLFGHALANLWLEPRGVLAQASPTTIQSLDRAGLDFYLMTHASSLRLMPAATRPEEGQTISGDHVRAALTALGRQFGHVVLDLPHGFSDVTLAGLEGADRVLLVATPERATLQDILQSRRILTDVLRVPADRITYVLNHPQPYSAVPMSDFAAATATPWFEVPFGGEAPSLAALKGESLVGTRPSNPVAKATIQLAEAITRQARELHALGGRLSLRGVAEP